MIEKTFTLASITFPRNLWDREEWLIDELQIQINGGPNHTYCHATIEWMSLGGLVACKLKLFDDGWNDLFDELLPVLKYYYCASNESSRSPHDFIATLLKHGFKPSEYHGKLENASQSYS